MEKEIILSRSAPPPIGPYSQAVHIDGWLYISGQLPIDVETGDIEKSDINRQTELVIKNIEAILTEAGASLKSLVKTTLYITNMDEFPYINEIYEQLIPLNPPARACVEVSRLPKDVGIEMDAVAYIR